jgi:hypothetical protein
VVTRLLPISNQAEKYHEEKRGDAIPNCVEWRPEPALRLVEEQTSLTGLLEGYDLAIDKVTTALPPAVVACPPSL